MSVAHRCVVQDWVCVLPFRMQAVLLSSLRSCDITGKGDPSKFIVRAIRSLVLFNADPSNTFMISEAPEDEHSEAFLGDLDRYPLHFVAHTMHAAEIIGYKYSSSYSVKIWWYNYYRALVKGLHLNIETEAELDVRLGFTPAELVITEAVWDAGTGTSHAKEY